MKLDDFHYHEAMDRLFMVTQILDDFVAEHPAIKRHKEVKKLVDRAGGSLAKAYQDMGEIIYKRDESRIKLNG